MGNKKNKEFDWEKLLNTSWKYLKIFFAVLIVGTIIFGAGTFYPNQLTTKRINTQLELYYIDKIKDLELREPSFEYSTDVQFVKAMHKCIDYINFTLEPNKRIPYELITAQAALESGWGMSRFAKEANNLYGIRTWDKEGKYILPTGIEKWPGWGVRKFTSKCQSVKEYIRILNEHPAYTDFRALRTQTMDPIKLVKTLTKFSTTEDYADRVIKIIVKVRKLENVVATDKKVEQ